MRFQVESERTTDICVKQDVAVGGGWLCEYGKGRRSSCASPRSCSRLSGSDRLPRHLRLLDLTANICFWERNNAVLHKCVGIFQSVLAPKAGCFGTRFEKKRHFIVSALNILKWVFSELICCATIDNKLYSCTARLLCNVLLFVLWLCWFSHLVCDTLCILQSSESAGGGCSFSVCVESLSCPTFYREEHIPRCMGRERRSRLRQQVASRVWRLPGHDLRHGPRLCLRWSSEKHWVLMAESLTAHKDTQHCYSQGIECIEGFAWTIEVKVAECRSKSSLWFFAMRMCRDQVSHVRNAASQSWCCKQRGLFCQSTIKLSVSLVKREFAAVAIVLFSFCSFWLCVKKINKSGLMEQLCFGAVAHKQRGGVWESLPVHPHQLLCTWKRGNGKWAIVKWIKPERNRVRNTLNPPDWQEMCVGQSVYEGPSRGGPCLK